MYRQFLNETNQLAINILYEEKVDVEKSQDKITVSIKGIGSAEGEFFTLDDQDAAYEGYPLGLDSYGKKEADKIWAKLEDDLIDRAFYLIDLKVEMEHRGKGYASKLMKALEDEAKKMRADAIIGNASPHGMGADRVPFTVLKKVYSRLGYKFLTIHKNKNGLIYKKL